MTKKFRVYAQKSPINWEYCFDVRFGKYPRFTGVPTSRNPFKSKYDKLYEITVKEIKRKKVAK